MDYKQAKQMIEDNTSIPNEAHAMLLEEFKPMQAMSEYQMKVAEYKFLSEYDEKE